MEYIKIKWVLQSSPKVTFIQCMNTEKLRKYNEAQLIRSINIGKYMYTIVYHMHTLQETKLNDAVTM